MVQLPLFKDGVVGLRLCLLEQMPDTPTDDVTIGGTNAAFFFFMWAGKNLGNGTGKAGFFGYEEAHDGERLSCINSQ